MRRILIHNLNKLTLAIALLSNVIVYHLFAAPDPITLLKGVESAREQIPPSRLIIKSRYIFLASPSEIITNGGEYLVIFNRERRYFKLITGDPAIQTLFTGSEAIVYDGTPMVEIRNLDMQKTEYLFDPRIIGITFWYGWKDTIHGCLSLGDQASKIELIGKEQIDNKDVWHIRLTKENDPYLVRDFWIDDKNNFRVYQCKDCFSNGTNLECNISKSYYESEEYPWLPSRVEIEIHNDIKQRIQVLKGTANLKIPENQWSLAGMEIPKNIEVTDIRVLRRIGYWDGKRLIPEGENPKPIPKVSFGKPAILIILILFSVIPLTIVVVRNLRKKE